MEIGKGAKLFEEALFDVLQWALESQDFEGFGLENFLDKKGYHWAVKDYFMSSLNTGLNEPNSLWYMYKSEFGGEVHTIYRISAWAYFQYTELVELREAREVASQAKLASEKSIGIAERSKQLAMWAVIAGVVSAGVSLLQLFVV